MSRAGGRTRLEPSAHSEPPASSSPFLPCCLLQTGTLCPALDPPSPPSPDDPHAQHNPAAAPSPWGGHPWEGCAGRIWAQGNWWLSTGQAGSKGTAGSGCVRLPQRKSLFRVIITRGPAILDRRGSQGTCHPPPRCVLGGPCAGLKLSPLAQRGIARARGACQAVRGDRGWVMAPHGSPACP